ncbi:MAG: hypothetical protein H7330_04480 [Hymenobacteraceae bacterium]|nr:hypothetical protein [Hymenobacteraceae bacterium]
MKTTWLSRAFLPLALLLVLGGCKKDDPKSIDRLPTATTEGKNTWGCLVNGEAWTSSGVKNMRADWTTGGLCYSVMLFSEKAVTVGIRKKFTPGAYKLSSIRGDTAFASARIVFKEYFGDSLVNG